MMRAAIAIGSNSTRLLAAEKRDGELKNVLRGREETRLFLGLDEDGSIRPERLESTAQAVLRLAVAAWQHGAETVELIATSATRDAKNGDALAARIYELCRLRLRVISGEEEAALAFRAVSRGERRLVMDIGGGSTEWTVGEDNRPQWSVSMQLGASRLLKMGEINSLSDAERTLNTARRIIAPNAALFRALPPVPAAVGIGGTCSTSAAMIMGHEAHDEGVEGQTVTLEQARAQLRLLAPMTPEQRRGVPGLPPGRVMHMPHGLCILIAALEAAGFDGLTVSGRNNLDGYLLSLDE